MVYHFMLCRERLAIYIEHTESLRGCTEGFVVCTVFRIIRYSRTYRRDLARLTDGERWRISDSLPQSRMGLTDKVYRIWDGWA